MIKDYFDQLFFFEIHVAQQHLTNGYYKNCYFSICFLVYVFTYFEGICPEALRPDADIIIRGHVTWVGSTSLEIAMNVEQVKSQLCLTTPI